MSDIAKLAFHDRVEIVGQALAIAAGVTPGKLHPWAADYHRRGDLSLAGVMATLGQSPAGFMTSSDLASSISEAVRIIALEAERPWEFMSARDYNSHGTHTSSTAGGNYGVPATGAASTPPRIVQGAGPGNRLAHCFCPTRLRRDARTAGGDLADEGIQRQRRRRLSGCEGRRK